MSAGLRTGRGATSLNCASLRRICTSEPGASAVEYDIDQPVGTDGSVHWYSLRASCGARFTQPWLFGAPKPSCQYAPCSAKSLWKYIVHGTALTAYGRPAESPCMSASEYLIQMRYVPSGVGFAARVDTSVANVGRRPSYATS